MAGVLHLTDCDGGGVPAVIDAILDHVPGRVGFIGRVADGFRNENATAFALAAPRSKNPMRVWRTYRQLERAVRECAPTLLHGHSSFGGLFGAMLSRKLKIPFIYTPHASPAMIPGLSLPDRIVTRLEWISCRAARIVLACSQDERDALLRLCPSSAVEVQPNGVQANFDRAAATGPQTWDIVNVGRLSTQKRPDLFVELADRVRALRPDVRIAWVGPGPAPESGSVAWIGGVSEDEVTRIVNRTRIFVSTSDYEGLSLAALRAAGAGCVLALRDTPGNRAPVQLGAQGFLFATPYEGAAQLARILAETDSAELRSARSSLSAEVFSLDRQMGQLREVYARSGWAVDGQR